MAATSGLGTTYGENAALNSLFGSGSPATAYLAIYSAAPTKAGGGTEITNVARKAVTNNDTNFPAASSGVKKLHVAQTSAAASGACAEATHWGIHSHGSSDQLMAWGAITVPFTCGVGDSYTFAVDALTITLANAGE